MKRAMACAMLLALSASTAWALDVGPGGYVYSSLGNGSPMASASLYRLTFDGNWDNTSKAVNFDTITFARTCSSSNGPSRVEVWDPRDAGGRGDLALLAPVTTNAGTTTADRQPLDVARVDADCATSNLLWTRGAGGNLLVQADYEYGGTHGTGRATMAVRTSENWGGKTTNGIGIAMHRWSRYSYRFDGNNSGTADNVAVTPAEYLTQAADPASPGSAGYDLEFGADGCTYDAAHAGSGGLITVQRSAWVSGALTTATFFTSGGTGNPVLKGGDSSSVSGLAVGGTAADPIVYLVGMNTDATSAVTIFALVDGDHDGVCSVADTDDCVTQVWKSGTLGLTVQANYGQDVEYYRDDNNVQWLLFAGGTGTMKSLYALQLYDNGLLAVDGTLIAASILPASSASSSGGGYFEFDMNPATAIVPEPATLSLLGTSALGVLGYARRKRMR